jgi:hypothetical protein
VAKISAAPRRCVRARVHPRGSGANGRWRDDARGAAATRAHHERARLFRIARNFRNTSWRTSRVSASLRVRLRTKPNNAPA